MVGADVVAVAAGAVLPALALTGVGAGWLVAWAGTVGVGLIPVAVDDSGCVVAVSGVGTLPD